MRKTTRNALAAAVPANGAGKLARVAQSAQAASRSAAAEQVLRESAEILRRSGEALEFMAAPVARSVVPGANEETYGITSSLEEVHSWLYRRRFVAFSRTFRRNDRHIPLVSTQYALFPGLFDGATDTYRRYRRRF